MASNPTKPQLARMRELDKQIRAGKYPNCTRFARDYGVSRKTIQRDIEWLCNTQRAPIEYDHDRRGYYYTDPTWSFSPVNLTESELLQLMLAQQMAAQMKGTPLAETVDSLLTKLTETAEEAVTIDPVFVRQQVSFHHAPARPIKKQIWTEVLNALRGNRVLKLKYRVVDKPDPSPREVEPIHLACVEGDWYLIAHDRHRDALRHFALSRIASAAATPEQFAFHDFDPEAYFRNRFGRYIGEPGRGELVQLRFDPEVAAAAQERQWHPRQQTKLNRDGSLVLSFPAPEQLVVLRWVLQWGEYVKVLRPKSLAEAVRSAATGLLGVYTSGH